MLFLLVIILLVLIITGGIVAVVCSRRRWRRRGRCDTRDGWARARGRRWGLGMASAGPRAPHASSSLAVQRARHALSGAQRGRNRGASAARRPIAQLQRQSAAQTLSGRRHTYFFVARRVRSIARGRFFSRAVKIEQAGAGLRIHADVVSSRRAPDDGRLRRRRRGAVLLRNFSRRTHYRRKAARARWRTRGAAGRQQNQQIA